MRYALRIGERAHPLSEGKALVGRGETCQLVLDDPLVSRVHAAIVTDAAGCRIEDLDSRNGVWVNGEKVREPRLLVLGDVVRIGSAELVVVESHGPPRASRDRTADTLVGGSSAQSMDVFGLFGNLADKALALGHGEEAERILSKPLEVYLGAGKSSRSLETPWPPGGEPKAEGELPPPHEDANFRRAAQYALRLASTTGKGRWLDYLFRLHDSHGRLMEAALVDELYEIVRKAQGTSSADLEAYLETLRSSEANRGPRERFLVGRLEGILALLR